MGEKQRWGENKNNPQKEKQQGKEERKRNLSLSLSSHTPLAQRVLGFLLASASAGSHFSSLLTLFARASEDEIFIIMKA